MCKNFNFSNLPKKFEKNKKNFPEKNFKKLKLVKKYTEEQKNNNIRFKILGGDPWEKIETFWRILKWISHSLEDHKRFLKKIIFPFSICVFIDLFKKGFYIEANFFLKKFNIDISKYSDYFSQKKILICRSKKIDSKKIAYLIDRKIFNLKIPKTIFKKLTNFLEKGGNRYFLDLLNNKFSVETGKKLLDFKKKQSKKRDLKTYTQTNLDKIKTKFISTPWSFFAKNSAAKMDSMEGFKILKIVLEKNLMSNCANLSSKEDILTIGLQDSSIMVFNLISHQKTTPRFSLCGHKKSIFSTKISSCGNFILSGSLNGEIFLWSLEFKKILGKYENQSDPIWDLDFSKSNNFFLSSCGDSSASLWTPSRIFPLRLFIGHKLGVNQIKWHPMETFFATGSDDNTVGLWDIRTAKRVGTIKTFDKPVQSVVFSPGGNEISFGGSSRFIDTWDLRGDKLSRRIKETSQIKKIKNILYSKNGKLMGYIGNQNVVKIWTRSNSKENNSKKKISDFFFPNQFIKGQLERILNFSFSRGCNGILIGSN